MKSKLKSKAYLNITRRTCSLGLSFKVKKKMSRGMIPLLKTWSIGGSGSVNNATLMTYLWAYRQWNNILSKLVIDNETMEINSPRRLPGLQCILLYLFLLIVYNLCNFNNMF